MSEAFASHETDSERDKWTALAETTRIVLKHTELFWAERETETSNEANKDSQPAR